MGTAEKGYRITYIGQVGQCRFTCELKDCDNWTEAEQGCGGEAWWPLYGNGYHLDLYVNTVAHRCCYNQPVGFQGEWYWPRPEGHEARGRMKGIPEAVKMWLDAGLPEDFRLPGQEGI